MFGLKLVILVLPYFLIWQIINLIVAGYIDVFVNNDRSTIAVWTDLHWICRSLSGYCLRQYYD